MYNSKIVITLCLLCLVNQSFSSPVSHIVNEGRGIGSTIWGWITYPFSWWSYEVTDNAADSQSEPSSSNEPITSIEIGKRNVTVWCNDQTCTTMRCDKFGCTNLTCNIYDTDLTGECRIYNTIAQPDEPASKPLESLPKPVENEKPAENNKPVENEEVSENNDKVIEKPSTNIASSSLKENEPPKEERPIQLEKILSSTVEDESSKNNSPAEPTN